MFAADLGSSAGGKAQSVFHEQKADPSLVVLLEDLTKSLNPFEINPENFPYEISFVHSPIFSVDPTGSWICRLCKSFPTVENGQIEILKKPDFGSGLKIHIEFDKRFRWGDGKLITAHDLYFTWQVASKLPESFLGSTFYSRIRQVLVETGYPHKAVIFLRGKANPLQDLGKLMLIPRHMEKPLWQKFKDNPEAYLKNCNYRVNPTNSGLYSGPYLPDRNSSLVANPYFPFELPYSKLHLKSRNQLKNNDLLTNITDSQHLLIPETAGKSFSESSWNQLERRLTNHKTIWVDSNLFEQIAFNLRNPILRDIRVRKALYHAVDKNHLIADLLSHTVVPAPHFVPPHHPCFSSGIKHYGYDPKVAIKGLEEAGWTLDSNTGFRKKQGRRLRLDLVTNSILSRSAVARSLAQAWATLGVDLNVTIVKNRVLYDEIIKKKNFEAMALFAWDRPHGASLYSMFSSDAVPGRRNSYQGHNIYHWMDYRVDRLLDQLRFEFDSGANKRSLLALQQRYVEELPAIPLYFHLARAFLPQRIQNFTTRGTLLPSSQFVHEWNTRGSKSLGFSTGR